MVIYIKKGFVKFLIVIIFVTIVLTNILINDRDLINKITIFLSSLLTIIISYLVGISKQKSGLINGLIIGITISTISIIYHFLFAKEFFSILYIRSAVIILSGACGGVLGVNKKTD